MEKKMADNKVETRITFLEKLSMLGIVFQSIIWFLYGIFAFGPRKGYRLSIGSSLFVRRLFHKASIYQLQWLLPSTDREYRRFAWLSRFQPQTFAFPDGSKAHWIGDKKAPQTILYLHGGGFICPITLAHLFWLASIRKKLEKAGTETSICLLSYHLAPKGRYPTQLRQAINLLRHVIEVDKIPPSQIIIGGDSAGGNLTLAVMSHLMHPHPDVPEFKIEEPFRGVMLISPWVGFEYEVSMRNQYKWDMLTPAALTRAVETFVGQTSTDNYNEAVKAPSSWWAPMGQLTRSTYVWYGGAEVLQGSIQQLIKTISESVELTTHKEPGGTHVSTIVDATVPFTAGVDETTLSWLKERSAGP